MDAAFVLFNPRAGGDRARQRWAAVQPALRDVCEPTVVELDASGMWRDRLAAALEAGTRFVIAAGGDGTVHALVNAIVRAPGRPTLDALRLGAVGLGSSNDFHKPVARRVAGVPLRLGPGAAPRDVGLARVVTPEGARFSECFVVSASIGIVAEANAFFQDGDTLQGWLRARWTTGAILNAARHAIAAQRNVPALLRVAGRTWRTDVTSLGVAKTPYVSGGFRYDAVVDPADGRLLVSLCSGMSRPRAVGALMSLARGRFAGRRGRSLWSSRRAALVPDRPVTLELDGEVCVARRVSFGVLPERIGICL
jgi:diacylglycerol kinase (ATP)